MGEVPPFTMATLPPLTSTPMTSCPAFARHAAVTHPTYPSPNTLTRISHVLRKVLAYCDEGPSTGPSSSPHSIAVDRLGRPAFHIGRPPLHPRRQSSEARPGFAGAPPSAGGLGGPFEGPP